MSWRDYEQSVFEILRTRFPAGEIESDIMIPGRFSKIDRQIDVVGSTSLLGHRMLAIADCKCYSKRVDVKDVEAAIGMAADVQADVALLITTVGYTNAALARAHYEPNVRIHLDIITPEQASRMGDAPASAVMYRGRIGAVVLAPSGWMVVSNSENGKRRLPFDALCFFHPTGLSVEQSLEQKSIGWCNIEEYSNGNPSHLEKTLARHFDGALEFDPSSEIDMWEESLGDLMQVRVRRIYYKNAKYLDITMFSEIDGAGVFWVCITSKLSGEQEALNRLRFVASCAFLALAPKVDPSRSDAVWQSFFPWRKGF